MSEGVCSGDIAQLNGDVRRVGRKNSVDIVEDTAKNALHQVSWPDLRRELFDVAQSVERLPWAWSEAECRERREGCDVVASGCCGGRSWWELLS